MAPRGSRDEWPRAARAMNSPAPRRAARGLSAERRGRAAEALAEAALSAAGWTILGRRLRTAAGEIDLAAERAGLLAFIEVKSRPSLAAAAAAITPRQQRRLLAAAAILLGEHPDWGQNGVRFDVVVVSAQGEIRRITDAFRAEA
jgi:putative endonuclease